MGTTATESKAASKTASRGPRARGGPARGTASSASRQAAERDQQYDLLTATLIGVAIGVGSTLLFSKGENGRRPISPVLGGVARGAKWAGRGIRSGAERVREEGGELLDRIPVERMEHALSESFSEAQERIDEAVRSEVHALRKAIRRQRQRLGL